MLQLIKTFLNGEREYFLSKRKGVSPVIATVLLIAMVVVIGLIVFLWIRGLNEDAITKFGKNVELVCGDVSFSADYDSSLLRIVNNGVVNIFNMKLKIFEPGSHETKDMIKDFSDWPSAGLSQGQAISISVNFGGSIDKIILVPVLVGKSEKGDKAFVCKEKDGRKVNLT